MRARRRDPCLRPRPPSRALAQGSIPPAFTSSSPATACAVPRDTALTHGAGGYYYGAAELSFVAWGSHADDLRPFPEVEGTAATVGLGFAPPTSASGTTVPTAP